MNHKPVLLEESIEQLAIIPNGVYIDATFGRGGHSTAILSKLNDSGRLLAFDKDPEAIAFAQAQLGTDPRFSIYHDSFAKLDKVLQRENISAVDGILMDLGVSSPQLDEASRGFSFARDGFLDMRMNTTSGPTAAEWIKRVSEKELSDVLFHYGEERYSRRIAKAIVDARHKTPITQTEQLAEIIKVAHPRWPKRIHPATQSFQAIRIAINAELSDLEQGLPLGYAALKPQGRLAVITFHSLEARIVKSVFRNMKLKIHNVKPSEEEIKANPRSRSAVLRVVEKKP